MKNVSGLKTNTFDFIPNLKKRLKRSIISFSFSHFFQFAFLFIFFSCGGGGESELDSVVSVPKSEPSPSQNTSPSNQSKALPSPPVDPFAHIALLLDPNPINGVSSDTSPIITGTQMNPLNGMSAQLFTESTCSSSLIDSGLIQSGSLNLTNSSFLNDGNQDGEKSFYLKVIDENSVVQVACKDLELSYMLDTQAPIVNQSQLSFTQVTSSSFSLLWVEAEDRSSIEYNIYYSDNLAEVSGIINDIETGNANLAQATQNPPPFVLENLIPQNTYHVVVIAKDTLGNKTLYSPASITLSSTNYVLNKSSLNTNEQGGQESFTLLLESEPVSGTVVIDLNLSGDTDEIQLSANSLTFNSANWNQEQSITVTGQNDNDDDGKAMVNIELVINQTLSSDEFHDIPNQMIMVYNHDDDNLPPTHIEITSPSSNLGNTLTPAIRVGENLSVDDVITLYKDSSCLEPISQGQVATEENIYITTSPLQDGDKVYSFYTIVFDPSENSYSNCSAGTTLSEAYSLDTTAPAAPDLNQWSLSLSSQGPDNFSSDATPEISGSGLSDAEGGTVYIFEGNNCTNLFDSLGSSIINSGSFSVSDIDFSLESDGQKNLYASIADLAGNLLSCIDLGANLSYILDRVAPSLVSSGITSDTSNGAYRVGAEIILQLPFEEIVLVDGAPRVFLDTGSSNIYASYESGSGTSTLNFKYTVGGSDASNDLDIQNSGAFDLNGATLTDKALNNAIVVLSNPGEPGSLGANKDIIIDNIPPATPNLALWNLTLAPTKINGFSSDETPVFSGSGLSDAEGGSVFIHLSSSCDSAQGSGNISSGNFTVNDIDLSAASDGAKNFYAQIFDAASNSSNCIELGSDLSYQLDTTNPSLSDSSLSVVSGSEKAVSFDLAWVNATDASPLNYKVYYSANSAHINTSIAQIEANASLVDPAGSSSPESLTGLSMGQTYFYVVVVEDSGGQKVAYSFGQIDLPDANFTLGQASLSTTEAGGDDQLGVVLDAAPATGNVVINLSTSGDTDEVSLDLSSLTFSTVNWNQEQIVTITGLDDTEDDGASAVTIHLSINQGLSSDEYDAVADQSVVVTNNDDDNDPATHITLQSPAATIGNSATPTLRVGNNLSATDTVTLYKDASCSQPISSAQEATGATLDITINALNDGDGTYNFYAQVTDPAEGSVSVCSAGTVFSESYTLDTEAPLLNSAGVNSSNNNDLYKLADEITITLPFEESVIVTGAPQILMETGSTQRYAIYESGSNSSTLTFKYTVQVGDESLDLDYKSSNAFELNGGSIIDLAGNTASISLPNPGDTGSLSANKNIEIDGTAPATPNLALWNLTLAPAKANGFSSDETPVFSGSGLSDAEGGSVFIHLSSSCDSAQGSGNISSGNFTVNDIDLSAASDGAKNFYAQIFDAASNSSNCIELGSDLSYQLDTTNPSLSDSSLSVVSGSEKAVSFDLAWVNATDASPLNYKVYYSANSAHINTSIAQIEANASLVDPAGSSSPESLTGLSMGQTYFYVVVVEDSGGQKVAYSFGQIDLPDANFTLGQASLSTTEAGGDDQLGVVLDAAPATGNVVINLSTSGDTDEVSLDLNALTFSAANWNQEQLVTITGLDDAEDDGASTVTIHLSINQGLSSNEYNAVSDQSIVVTNNDDDNVPATHITLQSPAATIGNSATPTLRVGDNLSATDTVTLYKDASCSQPISSAQEATGATLDITINALNDGDGTYNFYAQVTDPAEGSVSVCSAGTVFSESYTLDTEAPLLSSAGVNSSNNNDLYKLADEITITLPFEESVIVTGAPQILMETGSTQRYAIYESGSNSSTLTFKYTVQVGDESLDLDYKSSNAFELNGGSIIDLAGNTASISLPNPGDTGSLSANKNIEIDGTAPATPNLALWNLTLAPAKANGFSSDETPVFSGSGLSDAEGGSVFIHLSSSCDSAQGSGNISSGNFTVNDIDLSAASDGAKNFYAQIFDAASNSSNCIELGSDLSYQMDTTNPSLSDSSLSVVSGSEKAVSFDLAWVNATDASPLNYKVYYSANSAHINTSIAQIEANASLVDPAGSSSPESLTGLSMGQTYFYVVVVEDSGGQKVAYSFGQIDLPDANFTLGQASLSTTEAGGDDQLGVVLDAAPATGNVVINLSTSGDTDEVSLDLSSLTFSTVNWNQEQIVTITGLDDAEDDGASTVTIHLSINQGLSSDEYDAVADQSIVVTNSDDDNDPATHITLQSPAATIGNSATPTLRIGNNLSATDTVTLYKDASCSQPISSAQEATGATLDITINALNDGDGTYSFYAQVTDPSEGSVSICSAGTTTSQSYTLDTSLPTLTDSDLTVSNKTAISFDLSWTLANDNSALTYKVYYDTNSTHINTTIENVEANANVLNSTGSNSGDTLSGLPQGTTVYFVVIVEDLAGNKALYNANDTNLLSAGFTLSESTTTTSEAGTVDEVLIALISPPANGNVQIDIQLSGDTDEINLGSNSLTFNSANWSDPQTVQINPENDLIDDDDKNTNLIFTINDNLSSDEYDNVADQNITNTNIDNDQAGIVIQGLSGVTAEDGSTATAKVILNTEPTDDVIVSLSSSNPSEGLISIPSDSLLTFTNLNWNTEQEFTLEGQDDTDIDGNIIFSISATGTSALDTKYNNLNSNSIDVTNVDDDTPGGVIITPISGDTLETLTVENFSISLGVPPAQGTDVTINFQSNDPSEGTVNPTQVVFNTSNWATPVTIEVTGVDDTLFDGDQLFYIETLPAISSDPFYSGLDAPNVAVVNLDDESKGFTISPLSQNTTEANNGEATFTARLNSAPSQSVVLNFSLYQPKAGAPEAILDKTSLTFETSGWSQLQTVTVTGQNDSEQDGPQPFFVQFDESISTDPLYDNIKLSDVAGINEDDDSFVVTVDKSEGLLGEWGQDDVFSVVLLAAPTQDVTIPVSVSDETEADLQGIEELIFTSTDWDSPQLITVYHLDDNDVDGDQLSELNLGLVNSLDVNYNNFDPINPSLVTKDDDNIAVIVTPTAGGITTEVGGFTNFTVVLASQPDADVSISIVSDDPTEGEVSDSNIVFKSDDWFVEQTIAVNGINDEDTDGPILYTISMTATTAPSTNYDGVSIDTVYITNLDNDLAGISVTPLTEIQVSESGTTATFDIVLLAPPAPGETVDFTLSSSDTGEATIFPASYQFTENNWNAPKTFVVTGVSDNTQDGSQNISIITSNAVSGDPNYSNRNIQDIDVLVSDIDTPGAIVTPNYEDAQITDEWGLENYMTVVLTKAPTDDVTISLSVFDIDNNRNPIVPTADTEGDIFSSQATFPSCQCLIFTPTTWNIPLTVTVKGADDEIVDGQFQYFEVQTEPTESADPAYDGTVDPGDVRSATFDNDSSGFIYSPTPDWSQPIVVDENGTSKTFSLRLTRAPTDNVTIPVSSGDTDEVFVTPNELVYTPTNWYSPQTVTVVGVDDSDEDGDVLSWANFGEGISSDASFQITPQRYRIQILDND